MAGVPKFFQKFNSKDQELVRIQKNVEDALAPLSRSQLLNGRLIPSFALGSGPNTIEHKLGRKPLGCLIASNSTGAVLSYDVSDGDDKTFTISAATSTFVTLWVF